MSTSSNKSDTGQLWNWCDTLWWIQVFWVGFFFHALGKRCILCISIKEMETKEGKSTKNVYKMFTAIYRKLSFIVGVK